MRALAISIALAANLTLVAVIANAATTDSPACQPQVFVKNTSAGPLYECYTTTKPPSVEIMTRTTHGLCRRIGKNTFNCTDANPGAKEIFHALQGILISDAGVNERAHRGM